jgi:citrate synthase
MTTQLDQWVAAETVLSDVDGQAGRLVLRGFDLESLAGKRRYEDVVALLWNGVVDHGEADTNALRVALATARVGAFERLAPLVTGLSSRDTQEVMRLLLSAPCADGLNTPLGLLANVAIAAALATRHALELDLVRPQPDLDHAADLLCMLRGREGAPEEVKALDTYLVSAIDHGLNASTFTARVVASTNATTQNAVVAAFAALTGPLHGGAPGPVLDMLDAIGSAEQARGWIEAELQAGRRLMGFGHRIYQVRDPRADVLKAALQRLDPHAGRIGLAEAIEKVALDILNQKSRAKRLDINTEFYTALLLEALGILRASFTPVFAAARAAGWIAHAAEQKALGRLIRPLSRYVGPVPRQAA